MICQKICLIKIQKGLKIAIKIIILIKGAIQCLIINNSKIKVLIMEEIGMNFKIALMVKIYKIKVKIIKMKKKIDFSTRGEIGMSIKIALIVIIFRNIID